MMAGELTVLNATGARENQGLLPQGELATCTEEVVPGLRPRMAGLSGSPGSMGVAGPGRVPQPGHFISAPQFWGPLSSQKRSRLRG